MSDLTVFNRTELTKRLVAKLNAFDELISRPFDNGGPVLLAAKIDDSPRAAQTVRDPALIRSRFMNGLGTGRGGALDV